MASNQNIKLIEKTLWYLIASLLAILFIFPFYWMIVGAFSNLKQINAGRIGLWPSPLEWNWPDMAKGMVDPEFPLAFANSVKITVSAIPRVFISLMAAFALARLRGAGRNIVFYGILATVMIPYTILYIPHYIMFRTFGWIDTFWPFWGPAFAGDAFFIFLMRQFMLGIPRDLDDAAYVDGCSKWKLFTRITVPLCKPVIAVTAIFAFVGYWNAFLPALIFLSRSKNFPLTMAIYTLAHFAYQIPPWHVVMLGSLLSTIPLIIVFFLLQRYIRYGVVLSGLKA